MSTVRSWHWTDELAGSDGHREARKRTFKNWANYHDGETWHNTEWEIRHAGPDDSFDGLPLDWVATKQPLHFFVGDSAAASGRPWWGVRRSESADSGIVMFLERGDASGGYTANGGEKSITWEDVLPDTDLILYAGVGKIEKWISLLSDQAGDFSRGDRAVVGFWLPDDWTLEVLDDMSPGNRVQIKRPNGSVAYTSRPAYAVDANGDDVPCGFIDRGTDSLGGREYYRVEARCLPAGFTYPILMDPTVTISGTTDIEDTMIRGTAPVINIGGYSDLYSGGTNPDVFLARVATSAIPAGTIDSAKLHGHANGSQTWSAYRVAPASTWVEGSKAYAAAATGESCYAWAQRNVLYWAGGGSWSSSDYVADATPPKMTLAGGAWVSLSLKTLWFEGWRDGDYANNGFTCLGTASASKALRSTEATSNNLYFEIEYMTELPLSTYKTIGTHIAQNALDPRVLPRGK